MRIKSMRIKTQTPPPEEIVKMAGEKRGAFELKKNDREMHCRIDTDFFQPEDGVQSWRIFRIMSEFVAGFEILRKYSTAATFFGGARFTPKDPEYQAAEELSMRLAKSGFATITGGGPGIMEAANAGAFKAGGESVGLNIELASNQKLNSYTTESEGFHFFFSRKVMLSFAAEVYVYFPGGYGTLDEFMELITLVQTKKISKIPIVLFGKDFWQPLIDFMVNSLYEKYKTISKEDLDIFHLVDSVDEAYEYIIKQVDPETPKQI